MSLTILKPTEKLNKLLGREGPVYLLFGDMHKGNFRCEDECLMKNNCFSFYYNNPSIINLLNALGEKIKVDLFFERWYNKDVRHNISKITNKNQKILSTDSKSALSELASVLLNCLSFDPYVRKNCKALNFFIHMADPRHMESDYIDGLLRKDMTQKTYKEFKSLWKKNFSDFSLQEFFDIIVERLRMGPGKFLKTHLRNHPMFIRYSKINKQLSKLPTKLQDIFYNEYRQDHFEENKCQNPIKVSIDNLTEEAAYNKLQSIISYSKEEGNKCYWGGDVADLDLYFLGRSMKIPSSSQPTQLAVGYFGDHHVKNITELLTQQGLMTVEESSTNRTSNSFNKCVRS